MQQIELYRYVEQDGSITVTPNKRYDNDLIHKYRLIAEEEKTLFNGTDYAPVVDVIKSDVDKWTETDIPIDVLVTAETTEFM